MKRLISVSLALMLFLTMIIPAASAAPTSTVYVKGGWLRMRSAPSFDAPTIASFYTGTPLTYLGSSGYWYYLRAASGMTGYMYSTYLTTTPPGGGGSVVPQPSGGTGTAYIYSGNGRDVNLRSGPGMNYGVIGTYSVGTRVTILSRGTYWHYIKAGVQTGYMMAKYLQTSSPSGGGSGSVLPPSYNVNYTAWVWAANGKPVYLRRGPGKGYSAIRLYPVGTQVTVLNHSSVWDYIRVGTDMGYMMNQYLVTGYTPSPQPQPQPHSYTLNAVSISNTAPTVGTTLSTIVSPTGAIYSTQWYNELNQLLSSAQTYTVQYTDVGHRIWARVKGVSPYSGTKDSAKTSAVTYGWPTPSHQLTGVSLSLSNVRVNQSITAVAQPGGATASYRWYRDDGSNVGSSQVYTAQSADIGHRLYCVAIGTGSYTGTVASAFTQPVQPASPITQQLNGSVTLPNATTPGVTLSANLNLNSYAVTYNWQSNGVTVGTGATLYVTPSLAGTDLRLTVTAMPGSGYQGSVSSSYCIVQSSVNAPEPSSPSIELIGPETYPELITPFSESVSPELTTPSTYPELITPSSSSELITPIGGTVSPELITPYGGNTYGEGSFGGSTYPELVTPSGSSELITPAIESTYPELITPSASSELISPTVESTYPELITPSASSEIIAP